MNFLIYHILLPFFFGTVVTYLVFPLFLRLAHFEVKNKPLVRCLALDLACYKNLKIWFSGSDIYKPYAYMTALETSSRGNFLVTRDAYLDELVGSSKGVVFISQEQGGIKVTSDQGDIVLPPHLILCVLSEHVSLLDKLSWRILNRLAFLYPS